MHPRRDGERLVCALLWERRDQPSLEHFRLWAHADGPRLEGTVVLVQGSMPTTVEYEVVCAADWSTRRALVTMVHGGLPRRTELVADDGPLEARAVRVLPEAEVLHARHVVPLPEQAAREAVAVAARGGAHGARA